MSEEIQRRPAAWVVMSVNGVHGDHPLLTRPTLEEALAAIPAEVTARIKQGYSWRGCAMYVRPTEETVEVPL